MNWEGAGATSGTQVWRIENTRDENDNPTFGINPWPKNRYGEFYSGDSYIVLQTVETEGDGVLQYDIFFWIGSESSQDEYGVAAYKTKELDDLLDDAPVQHREVQYYESEEFRKCFAKGIQYLDGGIDGGFRSVKGKDDFEVPLRLYQIRRINRVTRFIQRKVECSSLNHGDAFLLDKGSVVFTWYGNESSPFEKRKAAEMAHNMVTERNGQAVLELDVGEKEEFWEIVGGNIDDVKGAEEYTDTNVEAEQQETKLYILSDKDSFVTIEERPAVKENLVSGDVCLVDIGKSIFVWIGKSSSLREQSQAMILAQKQSFAMGRGGNAVKIARVIEGQETRIPGFFEAF